MKELSYSEILEENQKMGKTLGSPVYKVAVLSNITVNLSKEILEHSLRCEKINAQVTIGDYDNIVQDSLKNKDADAAIIFWELCNTVDGLQFKADLYDDKKLRHLLEKVKSEIDLVVENLAGTSLVLINKFSSQAFSDLNPKENKFDRLVDDLNEFLEAKASNNIKLVNIQKVLTHTGLEQSIDARGFYSAKSLYSAAFYKAYADYVKPLILAVTGRSKKALVLDCDNTLWKGILGEDGFNNIEMSPQTKDGAIYAEVQSMVLSLNKEGIIVCLCSKNNPRDIEEVLSAHPDMLLKDEHITMKKINWFDKPQNIKEIAQELNIGLESIVLVDDSDFEADLVKNQIPEVTVMQVPKKLYDYPAAFRKITRLFYQPSRTQEDAKKTEIYKQQLKRESSKQEFPNIEDYLRSLGLKLMIIEGNDHLLPRLSQLSQKTNQFNLTTKRYAEGDIKNILKNSSKKIMAFSVSDKFGDSGITGMAVIDLQKDLLKAHMEAYMMSCRVIGRNIEYAFMDHIISFLKEKGFKHLTASYIKTSKNGITEDFYDRCSFNRTDVLSHGQEYAKNIDQYEPRNFDYIEVIHGKENKEDYVHSL